MGKKKSIKPLSSLYIATFSLWKQGERTAANGIMDPMMYYFKPRVKNLYLLDQPYPGSDKIMPIFEKYSNEKLKRKSKLLFTTIILYPLLWLSNKPGTHMIFKIRDLLSVIESGIRHRKHIELFIGLESINAIGGIFLRKLGHVKKVVYYVSDYSPTRFNNKTLNKIYLWLDKFCVYNADYIWDVSPAMHPARIQAGLKTDKKITVIHVPNALYKEQIDTISYPKREPYSCVFVGTLGLENGPDTAIKAIRIVRNKFPKVQLHIMGGGGLGFEEKYLKSLVKKYKLEKNIIFHGFISNQKILSDSIKYFKIALAPYRNIPGSIRLYGDATKIRLYMASGLPVITTPVPPLGKEVSKKNAAIVVEDNEKAFAEAIIDLFTDQKKGTILSNNASKFAKTNIWENTYGNALKQMQ